MDDEYNTFALTGRLLKLHPYIPKVPLRLPWAMNAPRLPFQGVLSLSTTCEAHNSSTFKALNLLTYSTTVISFCGVFAFSFKY